MNSSVKIAVTLLIGTAVGGVAVHQLQAQAKPPAYVIVQIGEVRDPSVVEELSSKMGAVNTGTWRKVPCAREKRRPRSTENPRARYFPPCAILTPHLGAEFFYYRGVANFSDLHDHVSGRLGLSLELMHSHATNGGPDQQRDGDLY